MAQESYGGHGKDTRKSSKPSGADAPEEKCEKGLHVNVTAQQFARIARIRAPEGSTSARCKLEMEPKEPPSKENELASPITTTSRSKKHISKKMEDAMELDEDEILDQAKVQETYGTEDEDYPSTSQGDVVRMAVRPSASIPSARAPQVENYERTPAISPNLFITTTPKILGTSGMVDHGRPPVRE